MSSPDERPVPLTFSKLYSRVMTPSATAQDITGLLEQHKSALVAAMTTTTTTGATEGGDNVTYLRFPEVASKFPRPTAAEDRCIRSLQAHYPIPRSLAANLLRDYLYERVESSLENVLESKTDLSSSAPLPNLYNYWTHEMKALCSILSKVFVAAMPGTSHSLHTAACSFVSANESELKTAVLSAVKAVLAFYNDNTPSNSQPVLPPSSCMQLLFTLTLCVKFTTSEREALLHAYANVTTHKAPTTLLSSGSFFDTSSSRLPLPALDGAIVSLLFVATVNNMNRTGESVRAFLATEKYVNSTQSSIDLDSDDIARFDATFKSLRNHPSLESVMLLFSWSALRQLQLRRHFSRELDSSDESTKLVFEHMSFAVSSNIFAIFEQFLANDVPLDTTISTHVFRVLWDDIVAFLCAFPPRDFSPSQASQLVTLSTRLLQEMSNSDVSAVSERLWNSETTMTSTLGANALLRIASGIFPQTYRPLVKFLTALTVGTGSAKEIVLYLSQGLYSVTERTDTFRDALHVLEDEENDIVQNIASQRGIDAEKIYRLFEMVRPSSEDVVFVQAAIDLPADSYRTGIERGSVGIANASQTVVTWIKHWNGFGAVARILQFVLSLLNNQDDAMQYDEVILEELSRHAVDTLNFIERLFGVGTSNVADNLLADVELVRMVSSIVSSIANPGDRALTSWLTHRRQEQLLTAAAMCLASITNSSADRARFALELIEGPQDAFPFRMALSSLSQSVFPAAAALSRIAYRSAHGDVISGDLRNVMETYSVADKRGSPPDLSWLGQSPKSVIKFLSGTVLPLWLTTSPSETLGGNESQHLYYLLPACSLDLFSADLPLLLQSPIASSLLSTIISASVETVHSTSLQDRDTFLFPALRSALSACFLALRKKNALLQQTHSQLKENGEALEKDITASHILGDTSVLEKMLLKPEITFALARLASGLAEKAQNDAFFERWTGSKFRAHIADFDTDRFWALSPSVGTLDETPVSYWRSWIAEMSARCLTLQFCCISLLSDENEIQVAWPAFQRSSFGNWLGGGAVIREAFANSILKSGSIPIIELLVSVLSCGQRAAARSLMAPRPDSPYDCNSKQNKTGVGRSSPSSSSCEVSEILAAVVACLRESNDEWSKRVGAIESEEAVEIRPALVLGQICLRIAACVRFLRVAWESNSGKWFEGCWRELKAWDLLAQLIRCEGSNARRSGRTDFSRALSLEPILRLVKEKGTRGEETNANSIRSLSKELTMVVDISSCWKAIVADVMLMFSSEIVQKVTGALANGVVDVADASEDRSEKFISEIYSTGSFSIFQSVFSERWMQILFDFDEGVRPLSSSAIRQSSSSRINIKSLNGPSQDSLSIEEHVKAAAASLTNLVFARNYVKEADLVRCFEREGDVVSRFGADYCFEVTRLLQFVLAGGHPIPDAWNIATDFAQVNLELTAQDVQAEVVHAFSTMSSAVVFADSFCLQPNARLAYSSPQYGGKVCRYLCKYLECIAPFLRTSTHAVAIVTEISKLIASLSTRLTTDEFEQTALTGVRFQTIRLPEDASSTNAVGHLCKVIDTLVQNVRESGLDHDHASQKLDIIRWLLLTSSKLALGPAFRSRADLTSLARSVMNVLSISGRVVFLSAAAAVALSAVIAQRVDAWQVLLDPKDIDTVFKTISSLSTVESEQDTVCHISGILLLTVAQGFGFKGAGSKSTRSYILRQLSGGSILKLLPPGTERIVTYDMNSENRNPRHVLWCACLRLANAVMSNESGLTNYGGGEDEVRDVVELSCTILGRISRESFDFNGDWSPSTASAENPGAKQLTIARVEEAEVAAMTLFQLARFGFHLRGTVPDLLGSAVAQLMRYTDQALRLLRAEPVERWVHPVTRQEQERSFLHYGDEEVGVNTGLSVGSPPWTGSSPSKGQSPSSPKPVKRSPIQALRAAVGDGMGRGSPVPPSPGFTPLSPTAGMPGSGQLSSSPLSPWVPHGAGLISETGLYYGEEVSRALLRGIGCALSALRLLTNILDAPLYSTSMVIYDDPPGVGSLLNILHHAGGELQRGTNEVRRNYLLKIAENAYMLIVFHVMRFSEERLLAQPVREELKRRIVNYIHRMRRCVPPPPESSVLSARELDHVWDQMR